MNRKEITARLLSYASEHPGAVLTGFYVMASAIGLIYSWYFFRGFGIDVLIYYEIGDFALASIKEPMTWLYTLMMVFLVIWDNAKSQSVEERGTKWWNRWYGNASYRKVNYLICLFGSVFLILVVADSELEDVRENQTATHQITLADETQKSRFVLGSTVKFLFLYDPVSKIVEAHPHESVITIQKTPNNNNKD